MNILKRWPKRSGETASRVIDDEAVIVIPDSGLVRTLNETAALIWKLCDGSHTVGDIAASVSEEFDISYEQAEKDTIDFIMELEGMDMVKLNHEPDM
jgi:hypothetical protein